MGLGKQAKVLSRHQIEAVADHVSRQRNGLRNKVIFLLSVKAGFRAKEIAALKWAMVVNADGEIAENICLTNDASKGQSGRVIPLNRYLRKTLIELYERDRLDPRFDAAINHVVRTERANHTSAQAIVNLFQRWYRDLGLIGCSSHSGRRTFITNAAKKISTVGGSLRDVQSLAGHSSLQTT